MALQESGVKLKVEGEAALSKALKSVDTALKALDVATRKAAKGFDDLANSTKKLDKIGNLNEKIAIQSKELTLLHAKLAKVKAEYGEESEQAQRAQLSIDRLSMSIRANQERVSALTKELEQEKKAQQDNLATQAKAADAAGKAAVAAGDLKEKLEQETISQNKATHATQEGVQALDRVDDSAVKASKGIDTLGDTMRRNGENFNAFGEIATGALRRVGEIAVNVGLDIARAMGEAFKTTVTLSGDYEAMLNRLSSVAGDSIGGTGLRLRDFDKLILQLGADTQYSALEVGNSLVDLLKGGVDPLIAKNGALAASLNLAAAGELETGKAAEILAKRLTVWADTGLTAGHAADVVAQAANASTASVEGLGYTLAATELVAKNAGATFDEVATTSALITGGFASASDAGTSMKAMFNSLIPKSKRQIIAFQELGLVNEQNQSLFYDTEGNFVGMAAAADLLNKAFEGLSEEAKNSLTEDAFGSDGSRAAILLAQEGSEGYLKMAADMKKAGTVLEQVKERNKGFNFALETLKGSIETVATVIGRFLNPALTDLMQNVLTPATNAVGSFFSKILDYQDTISFIDEFDISLKGVGKSLQKIGGDALELPEMGSATQKTLALNKAIKGMAQSFKGIIPDSALDNLEHLLRVTYDLGVKIFPDLAKGADGAKASLSEIGGNILASAFDALAGAIEFVGKNWGKIVSGVKTAQSAMSTAIGTIVKYKDVLIGAFAGLGIAAGIAAIVGILSTLGAVLAAVLSPIGLLIAGIVALSAAWYTNFGGIQEVVASVLPYVTQAFNTLWATIQEVAGYLTEVFFPVYAAIRFFGSGALTEIYNFVTGTNTSFLSLGAIVNVATVAFNTLVSGITSVLSAGLTKIIPILSEYGMKLVGWIAYAAPLVLTGLSRLLVSLTTYLMDNLPMWIATLLKWGTEAVAWVGRAIPPLIASLGQFLLAITTWATGTANPVLSGNGLEFSNRLSNWVDNELIPKIGPALLRFLEEIVKVLAKIIWEMTRQGVLIAQALIKGVIDGIKAGASRVYAAVSELFSGVTTTAQTATESHSPSQVFARLGRGLVEGLIQGVSNTTGLQAAMAPMLGIVSDTTDAFGAYILDAIEASDSWTDSIINVPKALRPFALAVGDVADNLLDLQSYLSEVIDTGESIGDSVNDSLNSWLNKLPESIRPAVQALGEMIVALKESGNSELAGKLVSVTQGLVDGMVNSLKQGAAPMRTATGGLFQGVITTAQSVTESHSPSAVFARIGQGLVAGLVQGLQSTGATGAAQSLFGPIISTANSLLPQWVSALARFSNESWQWAQRSIPLLKAQLLAWSMAIMAILNTALPAFVANLAMWSLEAWKWLQMAMVPLTAQMNLFTMALTTWAELTVLTALRSIATLWSISLWLWIPAELIPGIQPQWALFLEDCLMNMKKIEEAMYKAGKNVGKAIIKGTIEAIKEGKGKIIQIFQEIINSAIATAKQELGISSPSKVFYTIGEQIMMGMAAGISEGASVVSKVLDTSVGNLAPSAAMSLSPLALEVLAPPMPKLAGEYQTSVPTVPDMTGEYSATQMVGGMGGSVTSPMSANQIQQQSINNMTYNQQKSYNLNVNSTQQSQGVVNDFYLMQAMQGA